MSCKTCGQPPDTNHHFRGRWNNHKSNVRKVESGTIENVKQTFLQSLLLQNDDQGFLEDEEVMLTRKTQASHPTKREYYWMRIDYLDCYILL